MPLMFYLFFGSWEANYSGTPVNLDSANSNPLIFLAWIPINSNHLSCDNDTIIFAVFFERVDLMK